MAFNLEKAGYHAAELLDGLMSGEIKEPQRIMVEPLWVVARRSTDVIAIDDRCVAAALRFIRDNFHRPIGVADVVEQAGDRLLFVGVIESVVDLQKIRGLTPATDQTFKLDAPRTQRCLIEAVVSDRCPLAGKSIREGRFRSEYNAAVIAVARSGKRITARIGDIVLQPGDTLLLEAHQDFVQQRRNSSHFFLVSGVENSAPRRHERAWLALAILAAMVAVASFGWLDMLAASLLAGVLMILVRCCTGTEAR